MSVPVDTNWSLGCWVTLGGSTACSGQKFYERLRLVSVVIQQIQISNYRSSAMKTFHSQNSELKWFCSFLKI